MRKYLLAIKLSLVGISMLAGLNLAIGGVVSAQPVGLAQTNYSRVADINQSTDAACEGIKLAGGSCRGGGSGINNVLETLLNVLSAVVGLVAVVMIIISGFKFTTSGGDSQKVASAKSALIYAIIGLIIVALSQVIVQFVIGNV